MAYSTREKFKIKRCFDKVLIKKLHKKIFPTDVFHDSESVDWVVFNNAGQPVGFCMLSEENQETGYMARAGILPRYQGKGLHRRMIITRERMARKMNFSFMITYTKLHNIQSSVNLERLGYRLYIPQKQYADKDCLYWRKVLKKV